MALHSRLALHAGCTQTLCDGTHKHMQRGDTPSAAENPQVAAGGTKYLRLTLSLSASDAF
jgi:hypothetical protein